MEKYFISQILEDVKQLMLEVVDTSRGTLAIARELVIVTDEYGSVTVRKYILNSEYFSDAGKYEIKEHIESYNGGDYSLEVFKWYDGLYINVTLIGVTEDEINFFK